MKNIKLETVGMITSPGRLTRPTAAAAAGLLAVLAGLAAPVSRADDPDISALQQQLQSLQRQIDALKAQRAGAPLPTGAAPAASGSTAVPVQTASGGSTPTTVSPGPATGSGPSFNAGPTKVTLGGFVELMVVNRSRNEAADWASNFNTSIPFRQSHNYDLSEFHLTERQSRLQALVEGPFDPNYAVEGYVESDFGGATANGNNNQSTSFAPRVRHFYADYSDKNNGWYLLFGQTWSLVTAEKVGMSPRNENIPLTIDGQYVPGFDWLRIPQVRLVKKVGDFLNFGVTAENPAAQISSSTSDGAPAISVYDVSAGASNAFLTTNNITTDYLPDVVAKVALDPGYGHYEAFGLARFFRSRYIATGAQTNEFRTGDGIGGSFLVPVVPHLIDLQGSFIWGRGVGRYGSSGLPDVTVNPLNGALEPIRGYHALVGVIVRPAPAWTFFAYGGTERDDETTFIVTSGAHTYGYGYGNPLFDNSGCNTEGSGAVCTGNTRAITSETVGGWWKFYRGNLGNAQFGATWTFVRRDTFSGIGGDPSTNINIVLASFRYYPFQN
jgi:hypothetical protein